MTVTSHIYNYLEGTYSCVGPAYYQYVRCNFGWSDASSFNCDGFYLTDDNGGYFNCDDRPDYTESTNDPYGNLYEYTYDYNYLFNQSMVVNIRP